MKLGQKAINLQILTDAGFNVPDFYVIPAKSAKEGSSSQITKFNQWCRRTGVVRVAVRSSSNLEDTDSSSFAGQFKTVLDVSGDGEFSQALKEVSSFKIQGGEAPHNTEINVIVQEYIEPDTAGVLFTVNPSSGKSELVINCAPGNGESVVGGDAVNQYFVDRESGDVIGENLTLDKTARMSKKNIVELKNIALSIEKLFGNVQDIEWAIRDNQIYILQSRPITQLSHLRVWDSSNLSESFPGIVLPLTFSIARRGYNLVYKSQAYAAGLDWYQLEKNHRVFDSMVGIYNGKMYYNMISWYKFISLFPANKSNQKFLDQQLATVGDAVYMPSSSHGVKFTTIFWLRVIKRTLLFKRELRKFYGIYNDTFLSLDLLPNSKDVYYHLEKFELLETSLIPHFGRTVDNDFFVMTFHGILKKLLNKWRVELEKNAGFLGSMQNVVSADQALLLYSIAAEIKKDKVSLKLISTQEFDKLEKHIEQKEYRKQIEQYKSEFGHRFAEDQKIEAENPLLSRDGLYGFIGLFVKQDSEKIAKRLKLAFDNTKANEEDIERQLSLPRRLIYRFLLHKLKKHLRVREKNRLLRGKVYAYMRELFPHIGEALNDKGILEKKEDIYYLEIEEIYQILQGALVANDLELRVTSRKKAYRGYEKLSMPERFISTDVPMFTDIQPASTKTRSTKSIKGMISSPGTVTGKAVVLTKPVVPDEPFDILVVNHTDPGWTPLIALARGVVVEHGGMLSHAAIITRELGIPSIIGAEDATRIIKTGDTITISAEKAAVELHS